MNKKIIIGIFFMAILSLCTFTPNTVSAYGSDYIEAYIDAGNFALIQSYGVFTLYQVEFEGWLLDAGRYWTQMTLEGYSGYYVEVGIRGSPSTESKPRRHCFKKRRPRSLRNIRGQRFQRKNPDRKRTGFCGNKQVDQERG